MLGNEAQQSAVAVPATQQMSVQMELQQWNQVIGVLADSPYRLVAPLIQLIVDQLQRQAQQTAQANGHDP